MAGLPNKSIEETSPMSSPTSTVTTALFGQDLALNTAEQWDAWFSRIQTLLHAQPVEQPLALLLDLSPLETGYTLHMRARIEQVLAVVRASGKRVYAAVILPTMAGDCAAFLNPLLRHLETRRVRHLCFTQHREAIAWLQKRLESQSQPATQGG
jgi:hypothetical protein